MRSVLLIVFLMFLFWGDPDVFDVLRAFLIRVLG